MNVFCEGILYYSVMNYLMFIFILCLRIMVLHFNVKLRRKYFNETEIKLNI